jgi:hypothetical protein
MKKIFLYMLVASTILFASCEKDLDQYPKTETTRIRFMKKPKTTKLCWGNCTPRL